VTPVLKKIMPFIAGAVAVVILFLAIYLLYFRSAPSSGSERLIRMAPPDAFCIIESSRPADLLSEVRSTTYWNDFARTGVPGRYETLFRKMDTLANSYPRLKKILSEYPAVGGFHITANPSLSMFFIMEVPSRFHGSVMRRFIGEMAGVEPMATAKYLGRKIYFMKDPAGTKGFYYAFLNKCLIASTDSILQCRIMEQSVVRGHSPADVPSFEKVYRTAGKRVTAHLFIHNTVGKMMLPQLFDDIEPDLTNSPFLPDGWSAFDVTVKRNELVLNGFTAPNDSLSPFAQLFMGSLPENITIQKILPYNTVFSIQTTTRDFGDLLKKIRKYQGNEDTLFTTAIQSLRDPSVRIDLEKRMESIAGSEICLAVTGSAGYGREHNTFLILRSEDLETSLVSLNLLSDPAQNANLQAGAHMIRRLIIPNPFLALFGFSSGHNSLEWFTILDHFIVFGESQASIYRFLSYYLSGRTMGSDPSRSGYLEYFPESSNLSYNINIRYAGEDLLNSLKDTVRSAVLFNKEMLSRFEGLAVHYSTMNDMCFTTAHLNYNPAYTKESAYLWKTRLDSEISRGPLIIENPFTGKGNIVVFDQLNQMVLLDENGVIQWEKKLAGPVLSDVFQADYGQDHQPHLLCNTQDSIYLFSFDGRTAPGYPLPVPSGAGNGMILLDYNRNRDYRILLATKDRKILNLDIRGNPVKGWNSPVVNADVTEPVQHLVAAGKDYLIISLADGTVLMTDRKGNIRMKPGKSLLHAGRTAFFADADQAGGIMYSTDVNGNVVYINAKGSTRKVSFGDYLPGHSFVSADFDMDHKADFIFLDKNRVSILSRNRKPIAAFTFPEEISHPPMVFALPAGDTYLGFYSGASGNIYLLSKEGQEQWVNDMKSDHPYQIGHLGNTTTLHLVTGYRDEVFNYLFE